MSLWTPSGEHYPSKAPGEAPLGGPDGRAAEPAPGGRSGGSPGASGGSSGASGGSSGSSGGSSGSSGGSSATPGAAGAPGEEAVDVEALRHQLAEAPAEVVVANHCYGMFELAAVYLSQQPPLLSQAQLAIDALGFLVDGLGDRLGEARGALQDALAQIRLAYVQLNSSS